MTFSVVARCAESGMFGVAVSSSSPAVAARCAYARAGVGAVASQNITDPTLGTRGLELLALGADAPSALAVLRSTGGDHIAYRQITLLDASGKTAVFSGSHTLGCRAEAQAENIACAGNLLADEGVPSAMLAAFHASSGHLGDRLITVMQAARDAGGEEGPVHSAGLLLVRDVPWPVADLRVDWCDDDPIKALSDLWTLYKPQLDAYVTRALNPAAAPSYGVPGDA